MQALVEANLSQTNRLSTSGVFRAEGSKYAAASLLKFTASISQWNI